MSDEDQPEPAIVSEVTAEAQRVVRSICNYLQMCGWQGVVLSVTRVVEVTPSEMRSPGATATIVERHLLHTPVPHQIADVLRKQADMLDSYGTGDTRGGYIQDQSNYASNLSEWPE